MLITLDRKDLFNDELWEPQSEMNRQTRHTYGCFSFLGEHFGHVTLPSGLAQRVVELRGRFLSQVMPDMQANTNNEKTWTFKNLSDLIRHAHELITPDRRTFEAQRQHFIELSDRIMAAMHLYMEDILESVEADDEVDYRQALKVDQVSETDIAKVVFDLLMQTRTPKIDNRATATVIPEELRKYIEEAHGFAREIAKLEKGLTIFTRASLATFLVLPFFLPGELDLRDQVTSRVMIALFVLTVWGVLVKRPPSEDWWKAIKVIEYAQLAVSYAYGAEPPKINSKEIELREVLIRNKLLIGGIPTVIELHNEVVDEGVSLTRERLVGLLNTNAAIMRGMDGLCPRLKAVQQRERLCTIPVARNAPAPNGVVLH